MTDEIFDGVASYYDLIYKNKDYRGEAKYIDALVKKYAPSAKSIIDLGCGSGIHDWMLSEMGYEVTGFDQSDSMLELARLRSKEFPNVKQSPVFELGTLTEFRAKDPADVVVSLFDVVSYLPNYDAFASMCERLVLSLKPGGLLLFDCWYGPAVYSQGPGLSLKKLEDDKISLVRIADGRLNPTSNSVEVGYDIFITNKSDSTVEHIKELHILRCYFEDELDHLLKPFGFERVVNQVWFSEEKPSINSWSSLHGFRLKTN